jgi:multidrug efflux system membrane fusion protein
MKEAHAAPRPAVKTPAARARLAWLWLPALVALGAIAYLLYAHYGPSAAGSAAASAKEGFAGRAVPVVTATAHTGELNVYLTGLGNVTPFNTVTVRSRVDGQVDKVAFVEGQVVKQGDLLAEIDPRPFQVQREQAEGQYARDQAQFNNAKKNVERDTEAGAAISKQQLDADTSSMNQFAAAMQVDQGQIDAAKLQLAYCQITAPISGRIGLRLVDQGNIIHANDANGLAVITQLQPIAVVFSLTEDVVPQVQQKLHAGAKLEVDAFDRDLRTKIATGELLASDNQIDPTTGMLRFKAMFANTDNALFPNQFVNARLLIDTIKNTVLVPTPAVQRGLQDQSYVYVVTADPSTPDRGKVKMRNVTVGPAEGDETSITDGLAAGEVVVTDGVDKLIDDAAVTMRAGDGGAATTRPTSRPARSGAKSSSGGAHQHP